MILRNPVRRRLARLGARLGFVVSLGAFALSLVALVTGSPAAATPVAGVARITTPVSNAGGGDRLAKGDSATKFTLALPDGAACTGDTANRGFKVASYLVGGSIDPATLKFVGIDGPRPQKYGSPISEFRQPLHDDEGSPYTTGSTANADPPGGSGVIVNIPTFDLKVFDKAANLPAGEYNLGIACVDNTDNESPVIDKFWNTKIAVVADAADDGPVGISWTAAGSESSSPLESDADPAVTTGSGEAVGGQSAALAAAGVGEADAGSGGTPTGGYPSNGTSITPLAFTGSSFSAAVWGGLLLVFGRMALLLGRTPAVRPMGAT